ncbi:MAG: hypothetical protein BMS9Abin31_0951 [Gammaproteobacteria bacterium]|nr:MAG: hypothetical protein BMS9Abin31_0951 [Gammaproteobacteria bacterium]
MDYQNIAKQLGRRGGLKRAQNLSSKEKTRIARLGAKARIESLKAAARVEINFKYVEAIAQLNPPPKVKSVKSTNRKLPSIHDR